MDRRSGLACAAVMLTAVTMASVGGRVAGADQDESHLIVFENAAGQLGTLSTRGAIDLDNPFFQDLGTNGRRCVSCHQPGSAWTITPANVQFRFLATHGRDPIFSNNDGSNCEGATASTLAGEARAYSLLLSR